jgi:hypothetical protein
VHGAAYTVDFIHVENLAHAITLSLDRGTTGSAYYVTDGAPRPAREFLTGLLGTQGVALPSRSVPRPVATAVATVLETAYRAARRPTAPPLTRWLVAFMRRDRSYNIAAARRQLGYQPVISVDEGLAAIADLTSIDAPAYLVAGFGQQGVHLRGTAAAYEKFSGPKWLELHGDREWPHYYKRESVDRQIAFFTRFLTETEEELSMSGRWSATPGAAMPMHNSGRKPEHGHLTRRACDCTWTCPRAS